MALSKSVNFAHAQTAVPCNVCEEETPGEYYCIECKHTLCPPCEKYHRKFTKGHNVVLRTQLGDIDTTTLTCTDHGDQAFFHCEKCNIPVCGKCITGKHRGHEMSDLAEIFDREKETLQYNITMMQQNLRSVKKQRDEIITEKETYESKLNRMSEDMQVEKQILFRELDNIHNDRLKHIASIAESNVSKFDDCISMMDSKMETLEERISEYQRAIEGNSLPVVFGIVRRKDPLPEIGSKLILPVPPEFPPWNIQSTVERLRKLQVASPLLHLTHIHPTIVSKFTSPLKGWPIICSTKEGNIWLGGYESRELVMVDIKGQVLRKRKMRNRPAAMAVMDCGDIIISPNLKDSTVVTRLFADDIEEPVFDASESSFSTGVFITANQKVLICTGVGRVVLVNIDGSNVKEIYNGSGELTSRHAVEGTDGSIYVSNRSKSAVVRTTINGIILSTMTDEIGGNKIKHPFGMVVDKMGNILCTDFQNHVVYIIDPQLQQIKELIGQSLNIKKPRWLAVDGDNNLWITQEDGTVLIVKYFA